MQDRAHIDHIHASVGGSKVEHGLLQPVLQLVALFRLRHVLVVFQIVKDDQIRPVWAMTQAAHTLARAESLELHVLGGQNGADVPDAPAPCFGGEVHSKARVAVQFRLDRLQENRGLLQRVGNDQNVPLAPRQHAPQHEKQGDKCAFRFAARGGKCDMLAFAGFGHARQGGVKPCMQRAVARDRAIVRKIRPAKESEVGKRPFPALCGSLGIGREALAISFDLLLQGGGNVGDRVLKMFCRELFH